MTATGGTWRNWGRSARVRPARVERPAGVEAVQRAVRAAARQGLPIKAVGAGHSFSAVALAPGVLLELNALSGVLEVERERGRVRLAAGTRLYDLPRLLAPYGLALENMGDIDRQTIAGATSTGTHGTGGAFPGLAAQIAALTLVTADGELLTVSETENAELLPAARLGLGALGIIVDIIVQCVPSFLLHAEERPEPIDAVIDGYLERSAGADHFEFYWFPHTEIALTKTNTRLPGAGERHPLSPFARWVDDRLLAGAVYRATCTAGVVAPGIVPSVNRLATHLTGDRDFTDLSPSVFVTRRTVRFREMEYALPRAAVPEALREVRRLIERRRWRISFPIEVRSAAADENWLSTAYGRETGYIAVHRFHRENPMDYFAAVEQIMREHDGRPHWGKLHGRSAGDLRPAYPRFDDFVAVRDRLDPERRFGNAYLRTVLGD